MVAAAECDVVMAATEPELLNHKEMKKETVFQGARRCILCQERLQ